MKQPPPKKKIEELIKDQPKKEQPPPPGALEPVAGEGQVLRKEKVKMDQVTASLKLPIGCSVFDNKASVRFSVVKGFSTGAGITDTTLITVTCETSSGRRLADNAKFIAKINVPLGQGDTVKGQVEASGKNGVLINAIKNQALASGVATKELLEEPPRQTIAAAVEEGKEVTIMKAVNAPIVDDELTDGEIAAIVICVLIFFFGFAIGLWWANKQDPAPGPGGDYPSGPGGDYPSKPDYGVPSNQVEYKLEQTNGGAYDV